jgi:chromosome segregation protein
MYLEKIELQGFKSFARKTILQFAHEGKKNREVGLTVIVGPNGSGKSNIADAVRWVLGEQSLKLLRGKKSEDIIFAGSHKKSSLSFAEVSLYLNNETKRAPIDYSELVVTRRLYRDGEAEYLLNGSRVRLIDVQLLLAKARFGQRAYSVVGQGMVENFLNTTPAERKEFFDEATGVRMYQIKKHEAENKLANAQTNLEQAEALVAEIEPRMKSLTRQLKKLEQRTEIEKELSERQQNYYAGLWHALSDSLGVVNKRIVGLEEKQRGLNKELEKCTQELAGYERAFDVSQRRQLEREQERLRQQRDRLNQEVAEVRARKNIFLEAAGQGDVAWLNRRADELQDTLAATRKELQQSEDELTESNKQVVALRKEQNAVDEHIVERRREIISYHNGSTSDNVAITHKLKALLAEVFDLQDEIEKSFKAQADIATIKKQFVALRQKLSALKAATQDVAVAHSDADLEKINSEIITLEEEKNTLTERYITVQSRAATLQATVERLTESIAQYEREHSGLQQRLQKQQKQKKETDPGLNEREQTLAVEMKIIDGELEKIAVRLQADYREERERREAVITLQKKTHLLQNDYNANAAALSEAQIEKARVETRLEDLESEIRRETNNLRAVMDSHNFKKVNEAEEREAIARFKRQLELIGGIDPEIQKEYSETKERFDFLQTQALDLRAAITALQKVVVALEKTITAKFDKAFSEIAVQFERYFQILFDGGTAKLERLFEEEKKILDETEEVGEGEDRENKKTRKQENKSTVVLREKKRIFAGIDVTACPPRKKVKNISALSGGERALTAIALIAAIIAVNPSPFVMLDEVDAALDEANSLRLGKILEDLSQKTQFIAITHNRTIMYKADIIYGVTMGDDGVSKLLSVKVEDVQAARR